MKKTPFDYIKTIIETKIPLEITGDYCPFVINRGLSYHKDCVFYANEINSNSHLDSDLQYTFFINTIVPKKRYSKWVKKLESENLEVLQQYYGYNMQKTIEISKILTEEQISIIKQEMEQGGKNGRHISRSRD